MRSPLLPVDRRPEPRALGLGAHLQHRPAAPGPGQTDGAGAGDPDAICQRQVLHRDRRGEGQQPVTVRNNLNRVQDKLGVGTK